MVKTLEPPPLDVWTPGRLLDLEGFVDSSKNSTVDLEGLKSRLLYHQQRQRNTLTSPVQPQDPTTPICRKSVSPPVDTSIPLLLQNTPDSELLSSYDTRSRSRLKVWDGGKSHQP